MYFVYVLHCTDTKRNQKKFYVGITEDIEARFDKHKGFSVKTTKNYDRIKLVYYEACLDKTDALRREKQLKTGFGRGYLNRRLKSYLESVRE